MPYLVAYLDVLQVLRSKVRLYSPARVFTLCWPVSLLVVEPYLCVLSHAADALLCSGFYYYVLYDHSDEVLG